MEEYCSLFSTHHDVRVHVYVAIVMVHDFVSGLFSCYSVQSPVALGDIGIFFPLLVVMTEMLSRLSEYISFLFCSRF